MNNLKILFLGSQSSPVFKWLIDEGENVMFTENIISVDFILDHKFNFLISYGYRHILNKKILSLFGNSTANLHISFLPYNRGADPNLWSFIENTPKGVTIHRLDDGIDTGDIIVQKEIVFNNIEQQTLSTTYEILQSKIQSIFYENWYFIKNNTIQSSPQQGKGTSHKAKDKLKYEYLLKEKGWNTKVIDLINPQSNNEN